MKQKYDGVLPMPDTMYPGPDRRDSRENETAEKLTDDAAVSINFVPWGAEGGHLRPAGDDVIDAAWGVQDGARDVRQLKVMKELK